MRIAFAALLCSLLLAACSRAQKPADRFESIRLMVCNGQYERALPQLKSYSGQHNSRASLFVGKAHMALGDFAAARTAFESTVKKYPTSLEAHKSRYKLALLSYLQGHTAAAKLQFQTLAKKPDGPLAAEASAFAKFIK